MQPLIKYLTNNNNFNKTKFMKNRTVLTPAYKSVHEINHQIKSKCVSVRPSVCLYALFGKTAGRIGTVIS